MEREEHDERDAAPTGLPDDAEEGTPLGPPRIDPEGEGEPERGPEAMPGIPDAGEPPTSG
jgi:hypothetical protein